MWTLRNEPSYLANQYNGNIANEFNLIFNVLGVMGGFTDHTCKLSSSRSIAMPLLLPLLVAQCAMLQIWRSVYYTGCTGGSSTLVAAAMHHQVVCVPALPSTMSCTARCMSSMLQDAFSACHACNDAK